MIGPAQEASAHTQVKVLLIEDEPTDAELASRELKRAGIEHVTARVDTRDGFLRSLEAFKPDIVLSDFSMPHFDGLSALDIAREKAPDTPFIFVSGTIGEEVAIESLKRGAADYILKTNLKRLGPAVRRALDDVVERRARLVAERQLNEARMRFELFMRYLPGAAFLKDAQGRYQFVNWSWEEMTGRKAADVFNRTDGELWPDSALQFELHDRLVLDNNEAFRRTITFPQGDGVHHYLVQKFPIHGHDGNPTLLGGIAVDLTDRLRAEEKIARLSRIHAVLSGINSTIVRVRDRDELFRDACRIAVEHGRFRLAWIGWIEHATLEVKPVAWAGEASGYLARVRVSARENLPEGRGIVGEAVRSGKPVIADNMGGDPRLRYAEDALAHGLRSAVALPLQVDNQSVGAMTLYAEDPGVFDQDEMKLLAELAGDISFALDHIAKEERLNYLAYFDALTGLPNTTLFCERINQLATAIGTNGDSFAVAVFDVDRFRAINDSLGRNAGDALLKQVADYMREAVGRSGRVARVGSNRFAGVFDQVGAPTQIAHALEENFCSSLGRPFVVAGQELRVSSTAGIAFFPTDGGNAEALLNNAETALKQAKASGRRYLFYAPEMNARVADRLSIENRLRGAVDRNEFVLYYQPKVDLQSGAVSGVEALLRWNDPQTGMVPPGQFIPILEETGMIMEVGRWILQQARADHRKWSARGLEAPRIAVNVSALQLRSADFVAMVLEAVGANGADAGPIDLEITESLLMEDIEGNIRKLKALRERGIGIAIDDFGTGHSSLSYLTKLPVSELKIDRVFVNTMKDNPDSMAIVSSIISLAHSLNLHVVAEGVETEEQRNLLRLLKCDTMQGFLFSKPLPSTELESMVRARQ